MKYEKHEKNITYYQQHVRHLLTHVISAEGNMIIEAKKNSIGHIKEIR